MAGMVGAVEGEVAQRLELGLDPVEPGRVGRRVGELDVVGLGPLGDPRSFLVDRCGLKLSSTMAIRTSVGAGCAGSGRSAKNSVRPFLVVT